MKKNLSRFKIPTILGLGIIVIGIITGVFLALQEQIFTSKASASINLQNITLSNISDTEINISWQTSIPTPSFITLGVTNPNELVALDDQDGPASAGPKSHLIHYVTIKNLLPKTTYQYKIISGKLSSEVSKFTTAIPLQFQTGFRPIIGSAFDGNKPLDEGIAYISIADATTQSSIIKSSGNFLIPISQIRNIDLSDIYPLTEDTNGKLTILSPKGQATAVFKLRDVAKGLPPLRLGENVDLNTISPSPSPALNQDLDKYDLNGDGIINSADNSIILGNLGPLRPPSRNAGSEASKNPKNKKADLNGDGVVDQKDLDLMSKKINQ